MYKTIVFLWRKQRSTCFCKPNLFQIVDSGCIRERVTNAVKIKVSFEVNRDQLALENAVSSAANIKVTFFVISGWFHKFNSFAIKMIWNMKCKYIGHEYKKQKHSLYIVKCDRRSAYKDLRKIAKHSNFDCQNFTRFVYAEPIPFMRPFLSTCRSINATSYAVR